eukprot:1999302-Amphidinium_carterae.1
MDSDDGESKWVIPAVALGRMPRALVGLAPSGLGGPISIFCVAWLGKDAATNLTTCNRTTRPRACSIGRLSGPRACNQSQFSVVSDLLLPPLRAREIVNLPLSLYWQQQV